MQWVSREAWAYPAPELNSTRKSRRAIFSASDFTPPDSCITLFAERDGIGGIGPGIVE
jgi:hypothetical protein